MPITNYMIEKPQTPDGISRDTFKPVCKKVIGKKSCDICNCIRRDNTGKQYYIKTRLGNLCSSCASDQHII